MQTILACQRSFEYLQDWPQDRLVLSPSCCLFPHYPVTSVQEIVTLVSRHFVYSHENVIFLPSMPDYCGHLMNIGGFCLFFSRQFSMFADTSPRSLCCRRLLLVIAQHLFTYEIPIDSYLLRLWWIYHTLAHNSNLKTRGNHNFLDQMWWWLIFRYTHLIFDWVIDK